MGIYAMNEEIIKYIPQDKFYGFDDLVIDLIDRNIKPLSYRHDGLWLDIGQKTTILQIIQSSS